MLNGDHAPRREAPAVTDAIDLVEDGNLGIAGTQEIGVQRMAKPLRLDRARGGDERLRDHLTTKDALPRFLWRDTAEDVDLDRLEIEEREKCIEGLTHA